MTPIQRMEAAYVAERARAEAAEARLAHVLWLVDQSHWFDGHKANMRAAVIAAATGETK